MCHFHLTNNCAMHCALTAPLSSNMTCLVLKRPLKVSCCIDITQKQNRWSNPPPFLPVHTLPTLSLNESSFVEPLFPTDSKSSLYYSPMENVIPQWWIVIIVFLFSEVQAPRSRTCRSRRWALPRLSSNLITQISLCVHSVCPFI